ncbi:antibiotic biosynthesis monooxygenase family protein [Streptomyces sp. SAS_270]|uniref:antibiotic biosynthesis monooxygenase family protein n=1 Tax=Streptomyces sp. SAS_270 TaxID=3412748 RepID=UPI00403CC55C
MTVLMVRSTVKPEFTAELEDALRKMFTAIENAGPAGVRYASYRLPDGVTYVAQLELADGVENPLPAIQEFRDFQASLKDWLTGPPTVEHFEVRGSYSA